jgi:hypothetical protein
MHNPSYKNGIPHFLVLKGGEGKEAMSKSMPLEQKVNEARLSLHKHSEQP